MPLLKTRRTDLDALTRDELLDLKTELSEESLLIKNALEKAARKYEREGILADESWYDQNKERRLLVAIDLLKVDQKLRQMRRPKSPAHEHDSPYKKFYEVAGAVLPAELFSIIVEESGT